ncbi:MAG: ROK family protein, partial [Planctomycetota bacterium]
GVDREQIVGVGLATPGPMDIASGIITTPFNLPGWRHKNVRDILAGFVDRPVSFANDAGAAAFGEYWAGSGSDFESIILITLGTGVGGGIIINDLSIDGHHSHGAEIGHMMVDPSENARLCSCGKRGHLEAYASATAVVARCQELLPERKNSLVARMIEGGGRLSTLMIYQAAERKDAFAQELIDEAAYYLAIGVASLVHTVDPEAVLIGGAMTFGGDKSEVGLNFRESIRRQAAERSLPTLAEKLRVEFAELGSDAGFVGAAGLAKRDHDRHSKKNPIQQI